MIDFFCNHVEKGLGEARKHLHVGDDGVFVVCERASRPLVRGYEGKVSPCLAQINDYNADKKRDQLKIVLSII